MIQKLGISIFLIFSINSKAQLPSVASGNIERFENFESKLVTSRNIDVWLPEGYSFNEKYAVIYMHDGQMLYDASITWNKQAWEVDEVAGKLIIENKIPKFIVVGIWNNGKYRHSEFFPQKIIKDIPEPTNTIIIEQQLQNKPQSDNYLSFIVTELKPFIDAKFSTKKDKENTFIVGSSMGGLISLYAICEYPNVFGNAACISTHSPMVMKENINNLTDSHVASKFRKYLTSYLPDPKSHRIYFDYGDQTLDAFYKEYQQKIDTLMIGKGYSENWVTRFYPGKDHSEKSWRERLESVFLFLFNK